MARGSLEEELAKWEADLKTKRASRSPNIQNVPIRTKEGASIRAALTGQCQAYRSGDQMLCPCGISYDVNDEAPPICRSTGLQVGAKRIGG